MVRELYLIEVVTKQNPTKQVCLTYPIQVWPILTSTELFMRKFWFQGLCDTELLHQDKARFESHQSGLGSQLYHSFTVALEVTLNLTTQPLYF